MRLVVGTGFEASSSCTLYSDAYGWSGQTCSTRAYCVFRILSADGTEGSNSRIDLTKEVSRYRCVPFADKNQPR